MHNATTPTTLRTDTQIVGVFIATKIPSAILNKTYSVISDHGSDDPMAKQFRSILLRNIKRFASYFSLLFAACNLTCAPTSTSVNMCLLTPESLNSISMVTLRLSHPLNGSNQTGHRVCVDLPFFLCFLYLSVSVYACLPVYLCVHSFICRRFFMKVFFKGKKDDDEIFRLEREQEYEAGGV